MSFEHFLDDHTLSFIQEGNQMFICDGCVKPISGPCYGCEECIFYLHYECAKLPESIEHFLHPCPLSLSLYSYTCNACFMKGSGFSYRCNICHFNMHVECVSKPTISSENDEGLIQHFTHWHPLSLIDLNTFDEKPCCAICEKPCSPNSTYGCSSCNFFLHNSCMATIPRRTYHSFHPCPLILLPYPEYECFGCQRERSGLTYSCGKCRFKLDVKCGLLPTVEAKGADVIQSFTHSHPLALLGNKDAESTGLGARHRCRACGEDCLDHGFSCSISCDFFIHTSCIELPLEIHHPLHLLHPLYLMYLPLLLHGTDCSSCNQPLDGFLLAYRCDGCNFNLHKHCAEFRPSFKFGISLHVLTLWDKRPSPFDCYVCGKKASQNFLRCVLCRFTIHLFCLPSASKTITHKCHIDCLSLTQSPLDFELNRLEDAYNLDDEFYCDVCEEKREKKDPVYYCAECKFIAEVGCVISELVPSYIMPEEQNGVTSRAIAKDEDNSTIETRLAKLNNEIAELSAKLKLLIQEREPLKEEIERLNLKRVQMQERLRNIETELWQIARNIDNLEVESLPVKHPPKHHITENKLLTKASTSRGLSAEKARHMEDGSKLLPALNIPRDKESATGAEIKKVNIEILKLKVKEKALKVQNEKYRSTIKQLEEKLELINLRLKELQVDGFLHNDLLSRSMKENVYATEASTSE
ncbi:uncharacterized protein LOC105792042 isoform X1 [Gossypium raimondii]|uniref:Phorbol-ester/DAG-type domain-containing protein n=1 Tax=Gossypium raimondii TaxID=29730 RepID=A0A0D2S2Q5_GOSRA|nr:uncharacterized protein LOC105792042 isoform X1 [Gossypium raimondii]KJB25520.1 hypothetical protein B456_004G195800 [Gossypium raimondii]MBA0584324.1 hypothetical protein [Gossypium raimondii]